MKTAVISRQAQAWGGGGRGRGSREGRWERSLHTLSLHTLAPHTLSHPGLPVSPPPVETVTRLPAWVPGRTGEDPATSRQEAGEHRCAQSRAPSQHLTS